MLVTLVERLNFNLHIVKIFLFVLSKKKKKRVSFFVTEFSLTLGIQFTMLTMFTVEEIAIYNLTLKGLMAQQQWRAVSHGLVITIKYCYPHLREAWSS